MAFSLALPLLLNIATRGLGSLFLFLGLALAWSRIYISVHFPLDILGAVAVASVAVSMIWTTRGPLFLWVYPGLQRTYETMLVRLHAPEAIFPRDL